MTTATSKSNTSTATDSSANSKAAQVEAPFTEKATEAAIIIESYEPSANSMAPQYNNSGNTE